MSSTFQEGKLIRVIQFANDKWTVFHSSRNEVVLNKRDQFGHSTPPFDPRCWADVCQRATFLELLDTSQILECRPSDFEKSNDVEVDLITFEGAGNRMTVLFSAAHNHLPVRSVTFGADGHPIETSEIEYDLIQERGAFLPRRLVRTLSPSTTDSKVSQLLTSGKVYSNVTKYTLLDEAQAAQRRFTPPHDAKIIDRTVPKDVPVVVQMPLRPESSIKTPPPSTRQFRLVLILVNLTVAVALGVIWYRKRER